MASLVPRCGRQVAVAAVAAADAAAARVGALSDRLRAAEARRQTEVTAAAASSFAPDGAGDAGWRPSR
jgi:hypothetical protein